VAEVGLELESHLDEPVVEINGLVVELRRIRNANWRRRGGAASDLRRLNLRDLRSLRKRAASGLMRRGRRVTVLVVTRAQLRAAARSAQTPAPRCFALIELAVADCELRAQLSELIVVIGVRVLKGLVLRTALCGGQLALVIGVFERTRSATAAAVDAEVFESDEKR
jgi:hypothetical protein